MKKLICLLSALCATALLGACTVTLPEASSSESSTQKSELLSSEKDSSIEESIQESVQESISEEDSSIEESSQESASQEESSSEESLQESASQEESSSEEASSEENDQSSDSQEPEPPVTYQFTDFTAAEKALFMRYIGEVLPFPATDEYYVEGYYEEDDYENGLNFYTIGNTQEDFEAYRKLYSDYTLKDVYQENGDTWYYYKKDDIRVEMSYYYYDGWYFIDVYTYSSSLSNGDLGGGDVEEDDDEPADGIITNAGKGLPTGVNGVYNVDFTKATKVKNVTEQGYYLGGCPTTGSPAVLVIPVEFSDLTANSKGYTISKIKTAFTGEAGTTDYVSVYDYYYTSSYGKLDLDITVLDSWFQPKYSSSYYKNQTMDYYGSDVMIGDQMVMDEALATLSKTMDLSKFDSDKNGIIDSVVLITTLEINSDHDFTWAYRYWNIYTDRNENYYKYDNVYANDYLWAPYQFMHQDEDRRGNTIYTNTNALNTYAFIHEFGHILGADDYYDTAYVDAPMDGYDIMDGMVGDHNPYSKFNYGWLTNSRLVVAEDTLTLTLEDFSKNGDTIIIANNWDEKLGAYQEYYVLVYYRNTGLNGGEYGYFEEEGILVYHINASLYKDEELGTYDVYNTNTDPSDEYGTEDNLIEFVCSTNGDFVYLVGDKISANTTDDQGNKIAYTFTVDSLTSASATITFRKNN